MTDAARILLALLPALPGAAQTEAQEPPLPEHAWRTFGDLAAPRALAFTPDGGLLVVEADAGRLTLVDVARGDRRIFAGAGTPLGRLEEPGGLAIDDEGRVFVAETGRDRVLVLSPEGELVRALGRRGAGAGELAGPHGLDVRADVLAVADTGNDRVQLFHTDGEPIGAWSAGELAEPRGVAWLAGGALGVADTEHHRLRIVAANGTARVELGDWGPYPGLFARPADLATAGGRLFVCDRDNHRIQVFGEGPEPIGVIGAHALRPREGEGKLHYPDAIAVTPDGTTLAVAEVFEGRVQLFRTERTLPESDLPPLPGVVQAAAHFGTTVAASGPLLAIPEPESRVVNVYEDTGPEPRLVARVGGSGAGFGKLLAPDGVFLDEPERLLAVSDPVQRRLSLFRLRGWPQEELAFDPQMAIFVKCVDLARLAELEGEGRLPAPPEPGALTRGPEGEWYVADVRNDVVLVLSPELSLARVIGRHGTGAGELRRPTGLALSADAKTLLVVDSWNRRVQAFRATGEPLGALGQELGPEALALPDAIAVGPDGALFVTDVARSRIVVLDAKGELLRAFGSPGLLRDELLRPRGIALDTAGRLVVIDHANHRGMRLATDGGWVGAFGARLYTRPARLQRPAGAGGDEEDS